MRRVLPRLRLAGLALPFLTAGCMSGILPGSDVPDPSCVLLCALTRSLMGEPAPAPAATAAAAAVAAPTVAKPRSVRHAALAKPVAPKPPQRAAAIIHPRPIRHKTPAQVSVVPQAPAQAPARRPVAMVPSAPASVAVLPPPPAEPARDLSQAIPGSAGIMMPKWQGQ